LRGFGVAAVLGDAAEVDLAGELRRVLVLLVLGLEGADADAVLLADEQPLDADVLDDLRPVTFVVLEQLVEDEAARGIELAADVRAVAIALEPELRDRALAPLGRDELERLLVHRRREGLVAGGEVAELGRDHPLVREQRALGRAAVLLDALLEQAHDRALRGADRAVQQQDALLGSEAHRGGLEHRDQSHQRDVEAEDRIAAAVGLVVEEAKVRDLLLVVDVLLAAVADDHVVQPLVGGPCDARILPHDLEVVLERPAPVQVFVLLVILEGGDPVDELRHVPSRVG